MWLIMRRNNGGQKTLAQPGKTDQLVGQSEATNTIEHPGSFVGWLAAGVRKVYAVVSCCLNWKVIVALGVAGIGVAVLAPTSLVVALPVLVAVVCPASMLLMAWSMRKGGSHDTPSASPKPQDVIEGSSYSVSSQPDDKVNRVVDSPVVSST